MKNVLGINGYGLNEQEYINLVHLIYGFEEYYLYKNILYYQDYITVLDLLYKVSENSSSLSKEYKDAIIGWFIFFKNSKRRLAISDFAISVTDSCQLKCKHCYDQKNERKNSFMSYDRFKILMDTHYEYAKEFVNYNKSIKTKEIYFLGGEPTLNKDLPKMIRFLNDKNIICNIETNGIYMPDEVIYELLKYKKNNVYVSLDGLQNSHDFIRGEGSFEKSVSTIKNLLSLGINVGLNFVVNSRNYKDIPEFKTFIKDLGVKNFGISRYIDQDNSYISPISLLEYNEIKDYISKYPEHSCNIGTQTIITNDGGWRCCGKGGLPIVANYLTDSKEEFIKKIKIFTIMFRSVPVYCFDCKFVKTCMGGMMCSRLRKTNKRNIEDLTCIYSNCKETTTTYKIEL